MTDNLIEYEGGEILASLEERTISGLLLPYNELGRTNAGRFLVEAGAIELPADPSVAGLNLDHERSNPVGRAVKLEDTPQGVMATFKIANTPEGDAALADATSPDGKRRRLSAEFHAVIKAGKAVAGRLWGAALVQQGAFPSAMVLAADTDQPDDLPVPVDGNLSIAVDADTLPDSITATIPDGSSAVYTPEATPVEETPNPEGESPVTATEVNAGAQAPATAPATFTGPTARTEPRPVEARTVFASIASLKADPGNNDARQVLAAISDIKISGAGALPAAGVLQPNWLGELYSGIPYEREYITLANLGTNISAEGKKGFKVHRGTSGSPIASPAGIPNGGNWAGNKTEINSYAGFSDVYTSSLRRFAVGQDIAREFFDLPGGGEVIEAFLKLVIEDHLYWSDTAALYDIVTAGGAPVAKGTYPSNYPDALGQLIQGILAVKKRKTDGRRDVPTFAIANEKAYEELIFAAGGADNLPAFVNIALSTASNGTIDGNVQVVQGDTGITGTASVIVGSSKAIEFDELAGGPLLVNAIELALGGIDRAVHGYLQTFPVRDEAVVHIGAADARANTTDVPLGAIISVSAVIYRVVAAGTTGGSAPSAPAVGATVTDGTATLLRLV